jgi:hypothetical protein
MNMPMPLLVFMVVFMSMPMVMAMAVFMFMGVAVCMARSGLLQLLPHGLALLLLLLQLLCCCCLQPGLVHLYVHCVMGAACSTWRVVEVGGISEYICKEGRDRCIHCVIAAACST